MSGKTAMLFFFTVTVAVAAFAAGQQLPDGDGKKLIEDRCLICHDAGPIVSLKQNQEAWKKLVDKMVCFGAQLDDKESKVAVDSLAKYLGPPSSAPADPKADSKADSKDGADEKTAQGFIEGVCASCHDSGLVKTTQATKEQWSDIVTRMNGKGAGLSQRDTEFLVNYLAKTYAPK